MACQDTQQKLTAYHDKELTDDQLQAVAEHLTSCPTCRNDLDQLGDLDMLLKSCYSPEPPSATMDALWPSLSERLDQSLDAEELSTGGGSAATPASSAEVGELVFKSTPAMQILTIPAVAEPVAPVADSPDPVGPAAASAEAASPWRWPVAMILSSAIVVLGFLAYQKMNPPSHQPTYLASAAGEHQPQPPPGIHSPGGQPGEPGAPPHHPGAAPADEAAGNPDEAQAEPAPPFRLR